jgi:hypothetical protein
LQTGSPTAQNIPPAPLSDPGYGEPDDGAGSGRATRQNPLFPQPAKLYVPSGPSAYVHGFGQEQRRGTRRHFAVTATVLDFTRRVLDQSHLPHADEALVTGYGEGGGGGGGAAAASNSGEWVMGAPFAPERRVQRTVRGPVGARAGRRRANLFV